jgi:hypothetical protein
VVLGSDGDSESAGGEEEARENAHCDGSAPRRRMRGEEDQEPDVGL